MKGYCWNVSSGDCATKVTRTNSTGCQIQPGERLYIVAHDKLRGYAPVTRVARTDRGYAICRRGGAVAVTISERIRGFRGVRRVWWNRLDERPFPDWRKP